LDDDVHHKGLETKHILLNRQLFNGLSGWKVLKRILGWLDCGRVTCKTKKNITENCRSQRTEELLILKSANSSFERKLSGGSGRKRIGMYLEICLFL
jgi:hypothetical protein